MSVKLEDNALVVREAYMKQANEDPAVLARAMKRHLQGKDYDTLVGTGLSGGVVVPGLARELGKRWLVLRKPDDSPHAWDEGVGSLGKRWVFVDDFMESGATRDRVFRAMTRLVNRYNKSWHGVNVEPWYPEFAGSYFYEHERFVGPTTEYKGKGWSKTLWRPDRPELVNPNDDPQVEAEVEPWTIQFELPDPDPRFY